jgi:hypothetical protein
MKFPLNQWSLAQVKNLIQAGDFSTGFNDPRARVIPFPLDDGE